MATIVKTFFPHTSITLTRIAWLNMELGDDGASLELSDFSDRTVQVFGTFGGATVTLQGSNDDGVHWDTMTDPTGTELVFSTQGLRQILELPQLMRPLVTGGDGTTDLSVYAHLRGRLK